MPTAVRDSIETVDEQTWLIGGRLLLSRTSNQTPKEHGVIPGDTDDHSYSLRELDGSPPHAQASPSQPFPLVYDVGDAHAAWKIGKAYLKIVKSESPHVAREHSILHAMHQLEISFDLSLPRVLYRGEWDDRYYLITSEVSGQTLDRAWPQIDEPARTKCVKQVTEFCIKLSSFEGSRIECLGGGHLPEYYLTKSQEHTHDSFSPETLLENCKNAGMDCSTLHLYHCDLGPGNIIVDLERDTMGIIDFEDVGYVPKAWIRTKFRVSAGHDFNDIPWGDEARHEWRVRVQRALGEEGFPDAAESYMEWRRK